MGGGGGGLLRERLPAPALTQSSQDFSAVCLIRTPRKMALNLVPFILRRPELVLEIYSQENQVENHILLPASQVSIITSLIFYLPPSFPVL